MLKQEGEAPDRGSVILIVVLEVKFTVTDKPYPFPS